MSSLIISSPVPSRFTHVRAWRANYTVIHLTIRDTPSWLDGDPPEYTWYTAFYQVVVYHAIFNVIHHQVRYNFSDHFVHNKNAHSYNTRHSNWILVHHVKTEYRKRTTRYSGATVWNFMMERNINPNKHL